MKILLLDHPQYTSATFFLWHGLKKLEEISGGTLSVMCYPFMPTHYDEDQYDLNDMPWWKELSEWVLTAKRHGPGLPQGIPEFQTNEPVTSQGETIMRRGYPWGKFKKSGVAGDERSTVALLNEGYFDLIVLGNSHRVSTIMLGRLKELASKLPPIVYLDAGERDELNEHWIHVFQPSLVFKQILTPEVLKRGLSCGIQGYKLKMYPLPLSSPLVDNPEISFDGIPLRLLQENSISKTKVLQVYYALGNTWGPRAEVVKVLDDLVAKYNLSRVKGVHYTDYQFLISKSRMAVTMRGSGRDTTRYWEIPLYKTAMVADGTMGCIHPYPFEHGKTALFWRSPGELAQIVEKYLLESGSEAAELDAIARAGQKHLARYHSTTARAVFFLDVVAAELGAVDSGLASALARWKAEAGWENRSWEGPVV